jgi:hypothetical protein
MEFGREGFYKLLMYVCFVIYKLELDVLEIIYNERDGIMVMLGIHVWWLGGKANK